MKIQLLRTAFSIILSAAFTAAIAQSSGVGATAVTSGDQFLQKQNARDQIMSGAHMNPNSMVFGVPLPAGEVEGDFYLNPEFMPAQFELATSTKLYEDFLIRYDLRSNLIEINYDDGVRGLDGNKVKYFELASPGGFTRYVNSNQIGGAGEDLPENLFLQVLVTDDIPLYRFEEIYVKKADYNIAMNVGSRNDQILKKPAYLTVVNGKAIRLSRGKNSNLFELVPAKEAALRALAKKEKIKVKNEEDFIYLIRKLNTL